jgi:protease I
MPSRSNVELDGADPNDFDALLLPGGVQSPDRLRMNECAVAFVKASDAAGNQSRQSVMARGPSSMRNWFVASP